MVFNRPSSEPRMCCTIAYCEGLQGVHSNRRSHLTHVENFTEVIRQIHQQARAPASIVQKRMYSPRHAASRGGCAPSGDTLCRLLQQRLLAHVVGYVTRQDRLGDETRRFSLNAIASLRRRVTCANGADNNSPRGRRWLLKINASYNAWPVKRKRAPQRCSLAEASPGALMHTAIRKRVSHPLALLQNLIELEGSGCLENPRLQG